MSIRALCVRRLMPLFGLSVLSLLSAGCGGGATADAKVTVKPSELAAPEQVADGGTVAAADGVTAAGGKEPGQILGQITYDGAPPNLPPVVDPSKIKPEEANVCQPNVIGNDSLVVNGQNSGIQFVFVYLEKSPGKAPKDELPPVVFDNKSCRFSPHGVFIQAGQTLNVTNSDPIAHNTHTYPLRNTAFNQVVQAGGAPTPVTYKKPEKLPVEVKCDFHTWMKGYHLVLDHPWGAVTDADGKFELPELPPGKYDLKIWHEKAGYLERSVKVEVNGDQELNLKFAPAKFASFEGPRPKQVYIASR